MLGGFQVITVNLTEAVILLREAADRFERTL